MGNSLHIATMAVALAAFAATPSFAAPTTTPGLPAFQDDAAFHAYLKELLRQAEARRKRETARFAPKPGVVPPPPASPPAPVALQSPGTVGGNSTSLDTVAVTGSSVADSGSITNNQTQGVDEGDIVKRSGDFLIVLRRGRLFTVRIGDDRLAAASTTNAYGPDVDPKGTWYDEMLVSDGKVVVIGYSYERGGTEIGVFELGRDGSLRYRATYQLRGSDYYSARNYASRLVGNTLVFYTPIDIRLYGRFDPASNMPALRRWQGGSTRSQFKRILPGNRIYRSPAALDPDDGPTLHSVSRCDLSSTEMQCTSTGVLGPSGRVFYVSSDAVYVWTAPWEYDRKRPNASFVVRMPFDGSAPSGLRGSGSPIDQMSFLQRDGWLNVLVGSESDGEGMWSSHSRTGDLALLRVPLSAFGDGRRSVRRHEYRALSSIDMENFEPRNRFVGDWLLYGAGAWEWDERDGPKAIHAIRYEDGARVTTLSLGHGVNRIDALGKDGIVVGGAGKNLVFTTLRLQRTASTAGRHVQRDAKQGDDRTHGFFYKPEDEDSGLLGLPIVSDDESQGRHGSASVLFLRNQSLQLSQAGNLGSRDAHARDDGCKASCVDWYGNARPIFVGDRVFALLGYELVEGILRDGRVTERRRVDFSPR